MNGINNGIKNIVKRKISVLYNNVEEVLFEKKGIEITPKIVKDLQRINTSYALMKQMFEDDIRDSGERYFEHLKEVSFIVLNELEEPNIERIIIALLHDSIEDKEEIDFDFIKKIFGKKIAISVQAISKKPWKDYLSSEELDVYKNGSIVGDTIKIKELGKERRNKEYFGHIESFEKMQEYIKNIAEEKGEKLSEEELIKITKDTLNVKFADRIHNLRTQWDPNNLEKVLRKIEETEKYFLKIAKEVNYGAYKILKSLIFELRAKFVGASVSTDLILDN